MLYFLDIETATEYKTLSDAPERTQNLWVEKYHTKHIDTGEPDETYFKFGPLYPEFSKIVCVSMSYSKNAEIKTKSFFNDDEGKLLEELHEILITINRTKDQICGHAIKFFDIPFMIKRFIKHELVVPQSINTKGLKPWETGWIIDTNEMWNAGSIFKTSLDVICDVLDIPSPKDNIQGSDVNKTYWNGGISDIVEYCEKDTVATLQVYYRIKDFI